MLGLWHRLLLHLYPASFRHDYAQEMSWDFARRRAQARGPLALALLLFGTSAETVGHAAAAHWDLLRQDLRYAVRGLRRAPAFAVTAMLMVALGVGANTAAFTVADYVLLRPLPFREPERLVKIWQTQPGYSRTEASAVNFRDWQQQSLSFESLGIFTEMSRNVTGLGEPQRLAGALVSASLLPTLGVAPLLGRGFGSDDDAAGALGTVILSHALWQGAFGGEAAVLGRTIHLDDEPFTVIGVMPESFQFPRRESQFWTTFRFPPDAYEDRNDNWLQTVGRLKPGATLASARADMDVVAANQRRQFPAELGESGIAVIAMRDELPRQSRLLLVALCGASLCVLLIACANLASLLLGRGLARAHELAVRAAIGAGRERIVRQLATEGLLLGALGGVLGVAFAWGAVPLLARLVPAALPMAGGPAIDLRVLGFAVVLTALTGLAFSLVPALRATGKASAAGLREGERSGGGSGKERLRSALVVIEITASVVLLASASLLIRALWTVQARDPGFNADNVLTMTTALPWPKYQTTAARQVFYERVLGETRGLPGVTAAAYISHLPMVARGGIWPVLVPGEPEAAAAERPKASLRFLTPGFFASLQIPILRGRDVNAGDTAHALFVAIVSESFGAQHWPGQDPIGRRFKMALSDRTIVGVVRDIRVRGLEGSSEPQVYVPAPQVADGSLIGYVPKNLVVRTSVPPTGLAPAIGAIVRGADPQQPVSEVRTLRDIVSSETASRAVQARVIAAFALVAVLLAAIGIHGLLTLAVSQRAREFGVRVAFGAQPRDIVAMVSRQSLRLALLGVVPGVAAAYAVARGFEGLLAGIKPADPATLAAIAAFAVVMTLAGSIAPARRAVRIDPIQAIRPER